jgi:hypothetical protein
METLDLDVVENKAKFDRAPRRALIEHFKAWVASDEVRREVNLDELDQVYEGTRIVPWKAVFPYAWEQRAGDPQYLNSPRYRFFIQVDQECVESVRAIEDP